MTGKSMFQTKKTRKTMKKTIWSLAALMLMAAPVMTSCSNDLDEAAPVEEVKENVVTLTIKMPVQTETRVGIDGGTLKLTGWEQNDVVKVYHFDYDSDPKLTGGIPFKCIDPVSGTFSGTLPDGKDLDNYNFAVYGRDVEYNDDIDYTFFSAGDVHANLKDCICLVGKIDNGNCTMSIYNNVIKVTNNGSPVTGAWYWNNKFIKSYGCIDDSRDFMPYYNYIETVFDNAKITIPSGVSYIFMPLLVNKLGFVDQNDAPIIPVKDFGSGVVGKLYKVTIN